MKKKTLITAVVIGISLLSSTIAYAGGGWTFESVQIPAYQGTFLTGTQHKWSNDGAATAIRYEDTYDLNFCAMEHSAQIGERGHIYSSGNRGYSNYIIDPNEIKDTDLVYLQLNTRISYSASRPGHFYWSPDQPN